MKAADWAELLKKIPAEHYERMVAATQQGLEIAIHRVLCIESDYFLVRGRLGGTTDTFRLFCLPYDGLAYLGYSRPVPENELEQIFGPIIPPLAKAQEPEDEETPPEEATPAATLTEVKPSDSKITLLEKLRARAAAQSTGGTKNK